MKLHIFDSHPLSALGLSQLLRAQFGADAHIERVTACESAPSHLPRDAWLLVALHSPRDLAQVGLRAWLGAAGLRRTVFLVPPDGMGHMPANWLEDAAAKVSLGAPPHEVLTTLLRVFANERHVARTRQLSPRLRDVLAHMLQGLPNKVIARSLGLSDYTVKEYVSALLAHHGVSNRLELVLKVRQQGLFHQPVSTDFAAFA